MKTSDPQELPLVRTRMVGDIRIHTIEAGVQRLDGGAMFGVVPKPLWERRIPADERNRIPMGLRCLLVEAPEALVLVDTGIGNKDDAKFREIFGIQNEGSPTQLEDGIREAGFEPDDVELVVLTHLHFDHVGGASVRMEDGSIRPAFPGARHVVQRGELAFSQRDNERIRAAYPLSNIDPITEAGIWDPVEGDLVLTRGVRLLRTPGHTPHHQSILVESGGRTACYVADLCPTIAHIPLPWIMGYDLEPLVTLETKRSVWQRARDEEWLLIFEHDPMVAWGYLNERAMGLRDEAG